MPPAGALRLRDGRPDGPHTHIVGRSGAALANLWTTGKPCRWVCSCTKCAANGCFTQAAPF